MKNSFFPVFLLSFCYLFNTSYAQGVLKENPNTSVDKLSRKKFVESVSVFGNICINNYLGRLAGESSTRGNFGFNYGIQADFRNNYSVFISDDYGAYHYKDWPGGDHLYRISAYNIGLKHMFSELEGNQKFYARIGAGLYLYERNKDDNGNWVMNTDEVCFGGSIGVNCDIPLADFLSLSVDPVLHAFKTKEKSWLSFFAISAGLRLYVRV